MKKILPLFIVTTALFCENLILPNQNLFLSRYKTLEYIYSKDRNIEDIAEFHSKIIDIYTKEFGFKLDDKLYVILNSNNNQLANAISTQIPLNSQFLYNGGASYIDYFCFNSWIKNLIIHETSHNFQLNPKENIISKSASKVVKNSPFMYILGFPIFPIPNIMINPFILEGNAVLNESRFGNGGRLYSGYALAELVELANNNKITPNLMYNKTLNFPYGEKSYLIGGFFQKFLADRYGIKRVNSYFKLYSKQLVPLYVNATFKAHFKKDFETLLQEFVKDIKRRHKDYKRAKGEELIDTQIYVPMNRSSNGDILFLIGNFRDYPSIASFNGKKLKLKKDSYRVGEVFKIDGKYYTKSTAKTSPIKIEFGLFDNRGYIKKGTQGKAVEGFLNDGRVVYFDINNSFNIPQIYIDGIFYDSANSSVFIDKNDIYYFKQNKNIRTLYKNRKALFKYRGYYGFVTDVRGDNIYFIAPTKHGSGIYIFNGKEIKRAMSGDNIIDFKLIDKKRALINTIESNRYIYKIAKLNPRASKIAEYKEIKFKNTIKELKSVKLKSKKYTPLKNLKYSSLNQNFEYDSNGELIFNIGANFSDPATYNIANINIFKDNNKIVGGAEYENRENIIKFRGGVYGAEYKNGEESIGYRINLETPIAKRGYYSANLGIEYLKEYDSTQRPATLYLNIEDSRKFGISKYPSSLNSINLFLTDDRDNFLYGFRYKKLFQFGYQNFFEFNLESKRSDKLDIKREKGIKLDSTLDNIFQTPLQIEVLNIDKSRYVKNINSFEIGLYKSFDTPLYYFSFPLSMQRTTLYTKYKRFNIRDFTQTTFGIESDIVFFNNGVVPIRFEYIKTPYGKDNELFRVLTGIDF
jgi:hypothetical protein